MRIISWNVNGFRAVVKKGFWETFRRLRADVLCLQEIKMSEQPLSEVPLYWYPAKRKGYAGTAVFARAEPLSVKYGIGAPAFDDEGRVITLEYDDFYVVNAYFPNAQHGLTRLDFKLEFDRAIEKYVDGLRKKKHILLCGDFNVAHEEIDIARPKDNRGNAGFTDEEREWMTHFLSKGYVDTFRYFHPRTVKYSWWSYRFNARARNIGWRVDYVVVDEAFLPWVKDAFILTDVMGSDHAPVGVDLR